MKIVAVVGARPQFIKAAPVSHALREAGHREVLVHTGQHYDHSMSQVFFDELGLSPPDVNLEVGSGPHGWQTAEMLIGIEQVLERERPDVAVVYGDTNSTLAGALAACKLQIPLAHVEAGLRSFNRAMPEEHNRVVTDHVANVLFCPTETAVCNLSREGITAGVVLVGDTMFDAVQQFKAVAVERSQLLHTLGVSPKQYLLATVHRASNTDDIQQIRAILHAFSQLAEPIVFPVHPRTARVIETLRSTMSLSHVRFIDPVSYIDMLCLELHARLVLTDSGGVQKEAFFLGVPCITLRTETEWVETVAAGMNVVVGTDIDQILRAVASHEWPTAPDSSFGPAMRPGAAVRIVQTLDAFATGWRE